MKRRKFMKKFLVLLLALVLVLALVACNGNDETEETTDEVTTEESNTDESNTDEVDPFEDMAVMSYDEYIAAELDSPVVVEAYVQATQSWWDNKITVYLQDEDGGYLAYEMACSEEDAAKLVPGTKIQIKGYKTEWSGEVEIASGATFTFVEGAEPYIAEPADLTDILANEAELIKHQNELAVFYNLVVDKIEYKNGEPGDDIYVTVKQGENSFDFCVERYLTDPETDVYKAFADIAVGDVVNVEGFVYWYNGVNTHITAVQTVMTHAEYVAAELESPVMIEAYVQAAQVYSEQYGNTTLYLQAEDGAYLVYRYACTAEEYAKLTVGTKVRVIGYKSEWSGEVEIVDAVVFVVEGAEPYVAEAADLTSVLANADELIKHQNELAIFKGLTVEEIEYKNGEPGNDIYVTVKQGENSFDFCVESDLIGADTDVYKAFADLVAGDVVDITGFVYWYNGVNTHITGVAKVAAE